MGETCGIDSKALREGNLAENVERPTENEPHERNAEARTPGSAPSFRVREPLAYLHSLGKRTTLWLRIARYFNLRPAYVAMVAGCALCVGAGIAYFVRGDAKHEAVRGKGPVTLQPAPAHVATEPSLAGAPSAESLSLQERRRNAQHFGNAGSFRDAMSKAGVADADIAALVEGLKKIFDFRRCRPSDKFILERNSEGQLRLFEYFSGLTQIYRATRTAEGTFVAEQVKIPIERQRLVKGSLITDSLGAALEHLGLGRNLAGAFTEAFDGYISFTSDTRKGDSFRIAVDEEKIHGQFFRYGTVHALELVSERRGKLQAFWYEPRPGEADFYDAKGRALHGGWLRTPIQYDHISSPFNPKRFHPVLRRIVPHQGIDYAASIGTTVWAAGDGKVRSASFEGPSGNLVVLRHANGFESSYAHLSRIVPGIKPGVYVRQRQAIGYVGSTGRSTGPHLHFALKKHGRFIDPKTELNGRGQLMPRSVLGRYREHVRRVLAELQRVPLAQPPSGAAQPSPTENHAAD